jgi:O-antigen ligase
LYFSLRIEIEKNNINSTLLTLGILGLGIIFSLLGFFQLIYYPNIRNISYLGWDPHYGRLVSSFFDPNFAGIFLVLLFIFAVGVGFEKNVSKILKTCVLLSAIACFIALIFTFSRSSWISFIVGCIVLFSFNKKYRLLFFIILLFILSIILVSKPSGEGGKLNRQSTVTARLNNFDEFIKLSLEKPILGYGFNTLRYLKIKKSLIPKNEFYLNHAAGGVDNSLLFVLVTTGFFGLSAYLFLLFKIVKTALAKFNNNHASALILASSLAVLVHSFFQNTLFYPWVMLYMWMILARRELNR